MASMSETLENQEKKKQLLGQYQNQALMSSYRAKQKRNEDINSAGKLWNQAGRFGKVMAQNTDNPTLQNIGNRMYQFSPANLKDNGAKFLEQGANKLFNSGTTASNTANVASTAGNVADTAGKASSTIGTAGNAGNTLGNATNFAQATNATSGFGGTVQGASPVGAIGSGLSAVNNLAKKNYTDAGIDALSTGAMFVPGVGWALSGALQVGKMIKNMIKSKQQKNAEEAQQQGQQALLQGEATKQQAMQGLQQTQPQATATSPEQLKQQLGESVLGGTQTPQEQAPSHLYPIPEEVYGRILGIGYDTPSPQQEKFSLNDITPEDIENARRRKFLMGGGW